MPLHPVVLQYCLEEGISKLTDNDYVVHLDEETVIIEDAVRGIVNFIAEDKHALGQGWFDCIYFKELFVQLRPMRLAHFLCNVMKNNLHLKDFVFRTRRNHIWSST